MKVIFLDIDGVLNCDTTPNARKFPYMVDKALLARFRGLVKSSGAFVVLSSTWRVDPVGLMAAKFFEVPFHDVCPDMPGSPRCEEIIVWLRNRRTCPVTLFWTTIMTVWMNFPCFNPVARLA
jgi:hypothetical protein